MAIPVIDFSKFDGEERAKVMAQIANGCEEWGFFQLVNHGIPVELLEKVKKVCSEVFKNEREEGFKKSKPVKMLQDLVERNSSERLENVDWEDVFLLSNQNENEWPTKTVEFKETMKKYRVEVKKLAQKVMEIMDENLGLKKGHINKAFNGGQDEQETAFFGTKVSHYPPCANPEKAIGLRAHTDAGGVVLLFQDDVVGGLQILKDGEWIDVQPIPNSIVINTGDQIEVLSNGRYKSVWHRVLISNSGNRRSIASFYNPSLEATISPAPELVENEVKLPEEAAAKSEETAAYPKFVFGDYMSIYAEQKFLPKEPRFHAVQAM